jgi:hypothetical protein
MAKEVDMDEMKAAWNETLWPWGNVTPPMAYKGQGVRLMVMTAVKKAGMKTPDDLRPNNLLNEILW